MKSYISHKKTCIGDLEYISFCKSGINEFEGEKHYLDTASVDRFKISNEKTPITYKTRPSRANMQPTKNTVWFAKLKNSPKNIIVKDYMGNILQNKIFSTGFCGLSVDDKYFDLISIYIVSDIFDKEKDSLCIGATMQSVNNSSIKNISIPVFTEENHNDFQIYFDKLHKQSFNLTTENEYLLELKQLYLKKFFG